MKIFLPTTYWIFLSSLVLCPLTTHAQEEQEEDALHPFAKPTAKFQLSFGVEAGPNINFFSQTITHVTPVPKSPEHVLTTGSGISLFVGVFVEHAFSPKLALQLKLLYDSKKFGDTYTGEGDCVHDDGTISNATVEREQHISAAYIGVTPQLRIGVAQNFFVAVGPTVHFKSGDITGTDRLSIPASDDCYWRYDYDGNPVQANTVKTISGTLTARDSIINSTLFGAEISGGYIVTVSEKLSLLPQARFHYSFTPIFKDVKEIDGWRAPTIGPVEFSKTNRLLHSLQFSLAALIKL